MIIPAILTDSKEEMHRLTQLLNDQSEWFHIDILDNTLVKGETVSLKDVQQIQCTQKIEVHLMVDNPQQYFQECEDNNIQRVIVHREAKGFLLAKEKAKQYTFQLGVAVNPESSIEGLRDIEYIQIMSVQPGKQGNEFQEKVLDKLREVQKLYPDAKRAIDGGVDEKRLRDVIKAGAQNIVIGSAIVKKSSPQEALKKLQEEEKSVVK